MKPPVLHDSFLGLKLPHELREQLAAESRRRGISDSELARTALRELLASAPARRNGKRKMKVRRG